MKPVERVTGTLLPIPQANVDTDQILPGQFLKRVERSGFGPFLFYEWARDDPGFVLNRPEYAGARIIVAGPNFGAGSSREHAAWAIEDHGFAAVVASSFGDIFRSNCVNVGLIPAQLPQADVDTLLALAEADPSAEVTIDLVRQVVVSPCGEGHFEIDGFARHRLLQGLDAIGLTLQRLAEIEKFESSRPAHRPRLA